MRAIAPRLSLLTILTTTIAVAVTTNAEPMTIVDQNRIGNRLRSTYGCTTSACLGGEDRRYLG